MNCCGRRRLAWRQFSATSSTRNLEIGNVQEPLRNPVTLYHLADSSLVVKGAVTDITYLFGGRGTSLSVDERDVPTLLAMRQFSTTLSETP